MLPSVRGTRWSLRGELLPGAAGEWDGQCPLFGEGLEDGCSLKKKSPCCFYFRRCSFILLAVTDSFLSAHLQGWAPSDL